MCEKEKDNKRKKPTTYSGESTEHEDADIIKEEFDEIDTEEE